MLHEIASCITENHLFCFFTGVIGIVTAFMTALLICFFLVAERYHRFGEDIRIANRLPQSNDNEKHYKQRIQIESSCTHTDFKNEYDSVIKNGHYMLGLGLFIICSCLFSIITATYWKGDMVKIGLPIGILTAFLLWIAIAYMLIRESTKALTFQGTQCIIVDPIELNSKVGTPTITATSPEDNMRLPETRHRATEKIAYDLWEKADRPESNGEKFWLEAEKMISDKNGLSDLAQS